MTMKSLILGAAAGIASLGAAQAADLPMTKAEPVEYVKVCSTFGPGFFYIPGSDTCLKIGGEIRADYFVFGGKGFSRDDDRTRFGTEGRVWFDARTDTDWGLLRSYLQLNVFGANRNHDRTNNSEKNNLVVDKAFIQFGGLTAGFAHSFFGFYDNEYGDTVIAGYFAESNTVNLLAYTAQFGGGFQATLSIEDGRDHRADALGLQGGQQFPDVVGQVRADQAWGSIAVQAAAHQFRTSVDAHNDGLGSSKWGFAVGATGLLKIPGWSNGHFIVEGQYADGALDYLGAGNAGFLVAADRFPSSTGTSLKGGKGWSVTAELGGDITPVLGFNLVGAYIDVRNDNFVVDVDARQKEYILTGNLTYTLVKGLTVAGEVSYDRWSVNRPAADALDVTDRTNDSWFGGMRIKRTF